jgi:Lrp/AsnC family transcriptional regulator, leucine-responsive regulatory protein
MSWSGDDSLRLDAIDRGILDIVAQDGRISFRELGERIRLSPNTAAERLRRLLERGIVTGFHAHVDHAALGRPLQAFVEVRLRPTTTLEDIEPDLLALPQVIEAIHITGGSDYLLRVACRDTGELDDLLAELRRLGVAETETRIALRVLR